MIGCREGIRHILSGLTGSAIFLQPDSDRIGSIECTI
jgi:hypothetical protein